ncbi:hypothetical protein BCR39DRAFT_586920 [Naematelia encephala]|uniref:C2H2-type domain-containing protein n=1 Tax=Naematelia encephala TaxID=71784 RepID=A0A1Y2BD00_9TREE|nr:hypothetical protein BCR39DRAFT_586920 [Naematelia encephala]
MPRRELSPPSFSETQFDPSGSGEIWTVICILDERGQRNSGEYLVQWDGLDPETGKLWEATWERRRNCKADSIKDWKDRKAANPSIVGMEGKWWKGRAAAERRCQAEAEKSKKRKANSVTGDGRGKRRRNGHERGPSHSTSTTSKIQPSSPTSIEEVNEAGISRLTRQRTKKTQSVEPVPIPVDRKTATLSPSTSVARPVVEIERHRARLDPPYVSSDSSSPLPKNNGDETFIPDSSLSSPSIPRQKRIRQPLVPIASDEAVAVPSPVLPAQGAEPDRPRELGPVPQPSPSIFHPYLDRADTSTQSNRSIPQSQTDPIVDFSSPARALRSQVVPATQMGPPPGDIAESHDVKIENGSPPPRTITRYIDGEEVIVVVSESPETQSYAGSKDLLDESQQVIVTIDVETYEVQPESLPGVAEQAVQLGDDDADLEYLESVDEPSAEDGEKYPTGHSCQWLGCDESFASAEELAAHVQAHAVLNVPESAEDISLPPNEASAPPIDDRDDRIAALETENEELQRRLASASSSKKTMTNDLTFVRQQYEEASTRAVEEVRAAEALRAQNALLKEQLTVGLKQKDLHYQAVQQQRGDEAKQLRMQLKVYQDQATITDKIRQRAVMYPKIRIENTELKEKLLEAERRATMLAERNESLSEQIEWYRAKQMGVLDNVDRTSEEEDDYGSMSDTDEASSSVHGVSNPADIGYATRNSHITSSGDVFTSSQIGRPSQGSGFDLTGEEEADEVVIGADERWYTCTARDAEVECRVITRTAAGMRAHAKLHIQNAFQLASL